MARVFRVASAASVPNVFGRRRYVIVSALTAVAGIASLLAWSRWVNRPEAIARAFVRDCGNRNIENLKTLLDPQHSEAFHEKASEGILADLHQYVPRDYRILMSGHPNIDGMVTDRQRYHVLMEFAEPDEARQNHKTFVITLVETKKGDWKVDFKSTYFSLFASLYGSNGEQYLRRVYSMLQTRSRANTSAS